MKTYTQNFVTQCINRLEIQLSQLVNTIAYMNEKTFSNRTQLIWPKNHVILETKFLFHYSHLNLTKIKVFKINLPTHLFKRTDRVRKEYGRHDLTQNFITQSINRLEAQMSELVNAYRNEKTLPYQFLSNLTSLTLSIRPKIYGILETKIQFHHIHLNLTKIKNFRTTLIFW